MASEYFYDENLKNIYCILWDVVNIDSTLVQAVWHVVRGAQTRHVGVPRCRRVWASSLMFTRTLRNKIVAQSNIIKTKSHLAKPLVYVWVIPDLSTCIALTDNPSIVQTEHFRTQISSRRPPRPPFYCPVMPLQNRNYFFPWIWFAHTITWHFERLALISAINPKWQVRSRMVKF